MPIRRSLRVIRDEHLSLNTMLQSMLLMVQKGPLQGRPGAARFFDDLRGVLFYIAEFPERHHHPKESKLLFPRLLELAPHLQSTIEHLDSDHHEGQHRAHELLHRLMAWEYLGELRRKEFEQCLQSYVANYRAHMKLEETILLAEAERLFSDSDWRALDEAFQNHRDPLTYPTPEDPQLERLYSCIALRVPMEEQPF